MSSFLIARPGALAAVLSGTLAHVGDP